MASMISRLFRRRPRKPSLIREHDQRRIRLSIVLPPDLIRWDGYGPKVQWFLPDNLPNAR